MNKAKQNVKQVKKLSPNNKIAFSSVITKQNKKNSKILEISLWLKNYSSQKNTTATSQKNTHV